MTAAQAAPAAQSLHAEAVVLAPSGLADFNAAGVLNAADVHVAKAVGRIGGEEDPVVLLAVALCVRGLRLGHTCIDLRSVSETVTPEEGATLPLDALDWPDPPAWRDTVAGSPVAGNQLPLRVDGWRVYLDRYWRAEQVLVDALRARAGDVVAEVDEAALEAGLAEMDDPNQRRAAETAVRRRLAVIAGGPGTGKTTTLRKIVDLLVAQADALGLAAPRIALVAPTGKAAQRVTESLADDEYRALTIHKLLRRLPDNSTRFRHDRHNPLPHDVVVVDETSMVSLDLMAKLLDAIRPDARVLLVGDPDQLVSVEAGAVLGDIVGPARESADAEGPMAASIVVLQRARRYSEDSAIAALANAVRVGDDDAAVTVLAAGAEDVRWITVDVGDDSLDESLLTPVRDVVVAAGRALYDAAERGAAEEALAVLNRERLLCAHRHGPYGVSTWVPRVERWLTADVPGFAPVDPCYVGRPVLVTSNDYQLGVFNGDVGVTVRQGDRRVVAFAQSGGAAPKLLSTHRLEAVETVHAMTIHKSQGSQLAHPVIVLPDETSRILTRELFYTAATRAETALTVVATEAAVRAAVRRQVRRVSGLGERLWD